MIIFPIPVPIPENATTVNARAWPACYAAFQSVALRPSASSAVTEVISIIYKNGSNFRNPDNSAQLPDAFAHAYNT